MTPSIYSIHLFRTSHFHLGGVFQTFSSTPKIKARGDVWLSPYHAALQLNCKGKTTVKIPQIIDHSRTSEPGIFSHREVWQAVSNTVTYNMWPMPEHCTHPDLQNHCEWWCAIKGNKDSCLRFHPDPREDKTMLSSASRIPTPSVRRWRNFYFPKIYKTSFQLIAKNS